MIGYWWLDEWRGKRIERAIVYHKGQEESSSAEIISNNKLQYLLSKGIDFANWWAWEPLEFKPCREGHMEAYKHLGKNEVAAIHRH